MQEVTVEDTYWAVTKVGPGLPMITKLKYTVFRTVTGKGESLTGHQRPVGGGFTSDGARSQEIHDIHMIAEVAQDLEFRHEGFSFC